MYGNYGRSNGFTPPQPQPSIQNKPIKQMTAMHSDPNISAAFQTYDDTYMMNTSNRNSSFSGMGPALYDESSTRISGEGSPMMMSPWNQPFQKSPWMTQQHLSTSSPALPFHDDTSTTSITGPGGIPRPPTSDHNNILIGSLVREEGHVYSLATRPGDLLYTGSDSKNIRVWKNLKEFSGFKSASGLVKAIVISGEKIFTGHQDGKIRVWKVSPKDASIHKRSGSLPTLKEIFKCSMKPSNYVEVKRRRRSALWIKHSDAISCLSMCEGSGLLYSGSWDRTFKVWRIGDSKCLESVAAHEDAVNSVVAGSEGGLVFTGSADGTVKVWRREVSGKVTKHLFVKSLIKQECAVTALAVNPTGSIVYCGSSDGLVNFWERERNLEHGGVLRGHKLAVLCLVAKGMLVFSGSADKNICVWRRDGMRHECVAMLTSHGGPVKCLAVEEDVKKGEGMWVLYSGSLDKSVKVWSICERIESVTQQQQMMDVYSVSGSLRSDHSER